MTSAAPGLKMQFEDCFYLIVEIRRTSKREAKERRMGVDACAPRRSPLTCMLVSLPAPESLPFNQKQEKDAGGRLVLGLQHTSIPPSYLLHTAC